MAKKVKHLEEHAWYSHSAAMALARGRVGSLRGLFEGVFRVL